MTLQVPTDLNQARRQRDRQLRAAEVELEEAAAAAIRGLLRRMRARIESALTAATPPLPRMTSDLFTLGEVSGWWQQELDQNVTAVVLRQWQAGRVASSDAPVTQASLDSAGEYLSRVTDRLSRTATPTLPEQAFDRVRVALSEEMSRGSTTRTITERLGAELQWQGEDVGFWQGRLSELDSQVDQVLDAIGPPGDAAREAARLNDPQVRELQRQRSQAVQRLDTDRSTWQVRSERIARTESTGAYNAGAEDAYRREGAGVHVWIATADDRTREEHLDAHGQCRPLNEPFNVGGDLLQYPGDPSGSAEMIINCRCTTIAGTSCEDLGGMMSDADREIDHERADREDAERES